MASHIHLGHHTLWQVTGFKKVEVEMAVCECLQMQQPNFGYERIFKLMEM
jgi:hypothetical protein